MRFCRRREGQAGSDARPLWGRHRPGPGRVSASPRLRCWSWKCHCAGWSAEETSTVMCNPGLLSSTWFVFKICENVTLVPTHPASARMWAFLCVPSVLSCLHGSRAHGPGAASGRQQAPLLPLALLPHATQVPSLSQTEGCAPTGSRTTTRFAVAVGGRHGSHKASGVRSWLLPIGRAAGRPQQEARP